jgi:uncharacterized protein (TIGR02117 family)
MGERKRKRVRYRRRRRKPTLVGRILTALLAFPAAYMVAALIGSFATVNSGWAEPATGITIYLADNGIHTDIVMPVSAGGLDWNSLLPPGDFAEVKPDSAWIAFGSGEERVYLETPTWWDITPGTLWSALTGGKRVLHVDYVSSPSYAVREIRLRPEEYRRLWAAIRADFELGLDGRPVRIGHPGYGPSDSFYRQKGTFNALTSCNTWVAGKLRIAGVEASPWPPFAQGLLWRYRRAHAG